MTKDAKLKYLELIKEKKRRKKLKRDTYVPNEGQMPIHMSEKDEVYVFSGNGCWAKGTKVLKHNGDTINVEQVKIGDILLGPDGEEREVVKLYRGEEPLYKVVPKYGKPVICNESHKLRIQKYGAGTHKSIEFSEPTIKEWITWSDNQKRTSYLYRPQNLEFGNKKKDLQIDPYILGTWLGDGTSARPQITTMDKEIKEAWETEAENRFLKLKCYEIPDNRANTYSLVVDRGYKNSFLDDLRGYELINNKHIPREYKLAPYIDRLQLLAGLIDTDGSLSSGGFEIAQKSKKLAEDIKWLANSLGLNVAHKLKIVNEVEYQRLYITGPIYKIPCKLPRKIASKEDLQRTSNRQRFKIEPAGYGEFYGFQVDKDNLLLHEDFIIQRNSGKTTLLAHEVIWAAQGYNPIKDEFTKVPVSIVFLIDDAEKSDLLVIPEMRKWFQIDDKWFSKDGKPTTSSIKFPNGSRIKFLSHGIEPLKAEGVQFDFLAADEPPPLHIYNALTRGMRAKGSKKKSIIVGTPLTAPWLRTDVYEPWQKGELPYVDCFRMSSTVNKDNLDWERQEKFFARLTPEERKIRMSGAFFDLSGLALAGLFKRNKHVIEPFEWPRSWPCVVAIDPALNKPHVACLLGINHKDELFYLKEISSKVPARQFARQLKEWYNGYNIADIICDSLGSSGTSGGEGLSSFIEVLNDEGVRARATRYADKNDEVWMEMIQEVLYIDDKVKGAVPKLRIFKGNSGIITDIENVQWTKVKNMDAYKPKLDITKKDYLATLKYALAVKPSVKRQRARSMSFNEGGGSGNWRSREIY